MTVATSRIRVWDLPTRIFHWSLAGLTVFSFATGQAGGNWMPWHLRSGYAILTLLVFRLAWGFVGSETARFGHFVRGVRTASAYLLDTLGGRHPVIAGHNPLGGWSVLLMLAVLVVQVSTGLFSDDEIATQGPLAIKVSNAMVSRMSAVHAVNRWFVVALVVAHVAAIAIYRWKWDVRLAGAMVTGWMQAPPGVAEPRRRPLALAAVVLALAMAAVYVLVVVYPRSGAA